MTLSLVFRGLKKQVICVWQSFCTVKLSSGSQQLRLNSRLKSANKEIQLASLASNLTSLVFVILVAKMARFKLGLMIAKLLKTSKHII